MLLENVFRGSLSLYNIRIVEGRTGILGVQSGVVFTLNNTLYFGSIMAADRPDVLVHECTHIWQYQNHGTRYLAEALVSQATYKSEEDSPIGANSAYDWTMEASRGRPNWENFNKEAQASLIEDIWKEGSLSSGGITSVGKGVYYAADKCIPSKELKVDCVRKFPASRDGGANDSELADAAIISLRNGWNWRISRAFNP
jgi:hypothetical protein